MLSLNWLVLLLTLATVTRSEHYHIIVPVDSTDSCHDYRNGTCFTLEQLVQTDLLSGGDNLTLSFLPGDHVLTEQLLIRNFSHVQITGQNTSTTIHSNGAILLVSITKLIIERLDFIGANIGQRNSHQGLIIDGAHDVYIKDCYFLDFELLNQAKTHIVKIANTQTATIESTLFMNNTGRALHIEADEYVNITNSEFTRNDGGAVDIKSNSTLINNTEFNYNSARNGGAVEVVSGTVVITWCNFTNNKASLFGGAISAGSGNVFISDSELTNNSANYSGGAIYVYSGSASISNSDLTNNSADYGGAIYVYSGSVSISNSELTNNSADSNGGAIIVISGSVYISNSELTNNSADYAGGAIIVDSGNVYISDSELTNNSAKESGVIRAFRSSTLIINNTDITNNIGSLNISQSKVTFTGMNIVSNNGPIYALNSRVEFNGSTTLSNNRGMLGGAISADQSEIYINTEGVIITNNTATSGGAIFLRSSTLFVNEPVKIYHNTAQDGGGIYAYSSRIEFQPLVSMVDAGGDPLPPNKSSEITDNIAENNGGGIYAVSSTIELTQSYVNIDSNTATTSGGGVYLQQSSKLYLFKKDEEFQWTPDQYVKLLINNNLAQYGGGIFVADDTQRSACGGGATETDDTSTILADCFIQTINLYQLDVKNPNYFNTFMTNNVANQSGADIYGGLLDRCTISQNAEYHISSNGSGLDYINNTIKSSTKLSISSKPVQVMFCNYSQYHSVSTRKGHTFKTSIMAVDQVRNPTNATIRSSVITASGVGRLKEGQAEQEVGNHCTELEYNVFSQDSSAQMELYAEGPCINLEISRMLINIYFLPCTCPIGLKPIQSDIECKCDCDPDLQQYQITNCSDENGTIKLERNNNIWIGATNGTGYVVSNCVFDYCVEKPVDISLRNPDEQCAYNRSGILCGECESNFSLVLATSKCKECSNLYLILLIPFALAGILLVALILALNITIETGNIHGLIFYANVVAANRAIFFPNLNNFLTVFVSWVNLDLGMETCFYDGMNSQAKLFLQIVFPAYLFLLMFLIIILRKYFDSFAKLLSNRNPVAALGTLVLLSYSKLKFLRFIVAALQNRVLEYSDGSTKIVWLFDGNVQYFAPNHIPQLIAAGIILIAGGLFTVLLFFGQWFPRCSKVMKWTKNTGFMDAYHAPFTPKHRYWVGLLLFALIVHNLAVALAPDTFLPVLSSGAISVGLIGWKLLNNRLYKSKFCDSLESLYLLNVAILAVGTSYVKDTKRDQSALANTSMAISFTLFVITLCYHFYKFVLKKSNTWLKIEDAIRNLRAGAADMRLRQANNGREMYQLVADENDDDELLEAVDDYEQRDPPYTDGAVEDADPDHYITPPIIRPATRPDQPFMDKLAPLTTEDYRPAPPPPSRPAVTHTEIGPIHN